MERIHYAGDSVLTGTEIARALLEYANALAKADQSATVDIPVRRNDGTIGRANLLVGPASQLISETEENPFGEVLDPPLVEYLRAETAVLRPPRPVTGGRQDEDLNRMDDL